MPFVGATTTAYVKALPSRSLPVSVIATGVSSLVVTAWALAIGASLTASTESRTSRVLLADAPSFTTNETVRLEPLGVSERLV